MCRLTPFRCSAQREGKRERKRINEKFLLFCVFDGFIVVTLCFAMQYLYLHETMLTVKFPQSHTNQKAQVMSAGGD